MRLETRKATKNGRRMRVAYSGKHEKDWPLGFHFWNLRLLLGEYEDSAYLLALRYPTRCRRPSQMYSAAPQPRDLMIPKKKLTISFKALLSISQIKHPLPPIRDRHTQWTPRHPRIPRPLTDQPLPILLPSTSNSWTTCKHRTPPTKHRFIPSQHAPRVPKLRTRHRRRSFRAA